MLNHSSTSSRNSSGLSLGADGRLAGAGSGSGLNSFHLAPAAAAGSTLPGAGANSADRALATAASTAKDAVDTVVKLADAQMARAEVSPSAVNLGFKFGDDHLGVRVEIRGGQVHTSFSTNSPELRDALSAQFVALTSGTGTGSGSSNSGGHPDRPFQFASPQFTNSSAGGDQRGSRQNSPQTSSDFVTEGLGGSNSSASSGRSASLSVSSRPTASADLAAGGALHLHAFA